MEGADRIYELLSARVDGTVTNDDIEEAVNKLLKDEEIQPPVPKKAKVDKKPATAPYNYQEIEEDMENYDDNEDEEDGGYAPAEASPRRRKRKSRDLRTEWKKELKEQLKRYEHIPLGQQAAKMMVTFGDGKHPKPETVEKALLGARKMIQVAIQDARHLRRQNQQIFKAAQTALRNDKPSIPENQGEWSNAVMYRALKGKDQLSYDLKGGFGLEELQQLFPEEINAYTKWNELNEQVKKKDNKKQELDDDENDNNDAPEDTKMSAIDEYGHLKERAGQFDVRTDRMQSEWYLRFSEVRQGSFLPKRNRTAEDIDWDSARKTGQRGKPKGRAGTWTQLTSKAVRFLHWVGFDPQSALPPPKMETAEALAFLTYDFFGKVIERAIYHRTLEKLKKEAQEDESDLILELESGEQLDPVDVDKAMEDPMVKPVPIYSSSDVAQPQLYFGPGFEERLELELEEFMSKKHLPEDEIEFRRAEEELFAKLEAPPDKSAVDKVLGVAGDDSDEEEPDDDETELGSGEEEELEQAGVPAADIRDSATKTANV